MRNGRVWFTADLHLGHANIIKYCGRPFDTAWEMDDYIIHMWNSMVDYNDTIYILGDFTLKRLEAAKDYFSRLKGRINVIPGGHDYRWLRDFRKHVNCLIDIPMSLTGCVEVKEVIYSCTIDGLDLVLCHYPMRTWHKSHYGSIQLHGHSHGKLDPLPNQYDVGLDNNELLLVSLDYIRERFADGST